MMDRTDPYAMFLLLAVWVLLILVVDPLLRHSLTNPGALLDPLGLSAIEADAVGADKLQSQ